MSWVLSIGFSGSWLVSSAIMSFRNWLISRSFRSRTPFCGDSAPEAPEMLEGAIEARLAIGFLSTDGLDDDIQPAGRTGDWRWTGDGRGLRPRTRGGSDPRQPRLRFGLLAARLIGRFPRVALHQIHI